MAGYIYRSVWYKQQPNGALNISSYAGIASGLMNKDEALGKAVREGQDAFPEHTLNHVSATKLNANMIEALYEELQEERAQQQNQAI